MEGFELAFYGADEGVVGVKFEGWGGEEGKGEGMEGLATLEEGVKEGGVVGKGKGLDGGKGG